MIQWNVHYAPVSSVECPWLFQVVPDGLPPQTPAAGFSYMSLDYDVAYPQHTNLDTGQKLFSKIMG